MEYTADGKSRCLAPLALWSVLPCNTGHCKSQAHFWKILCNFLNYLQLSVSGCTASSTMGPDPLIRFLATSAIQITIQFCHFLLWKELLAPVKMGFGDVSLWWKGKFIATLYRAIKVHSALQITNENKVLVPKEQHLTETHKGLHRKSEKFKANGQRVNICFSYTSPPC